jgi:transposase InsO family protein
MTTTMTNTRIYNLNDLENLVTSLAGFSFKAKGRKETYEWVEKMLFGYRYRTLSKKNKGIVQKYLLKMTGYSEVQIKRFCGTFLKENKLRLKDYDRHRFGKIYTREDIARLARVDLAHRALSGPATRKILQREYEVFGKNDFVNIAKVSVSHIYNLRKTFTYRDKVKIFHETHSVKNTLGQRRKPQPEGRPGFIRVDTVHQGDSHDGKKGVYYINFVDEVIQWEMVACVQTISEIHMAPILKQILDQYPFIVLNFHSDNGSEFINKLVARILEKLRIELTKSRPRRHNDNALVETKNGSVIRKHMGYIHIPQTFAEKINVWCTEWFNPYLNYHRPCGFAKIIKDKNGKEKFIYPRDGYETPFEKLKSLKDCEQYLKPETNIAKLNEIAYSVSDTEFAEAMNIAKAELFNEIRESIKENIETLFE